MNKPHTSHVRAFLLNRYTYYSLRVISIGLFGYVIADSATRRISKAFNTQGEAQTALRTWQVIPLWDKLSKLWTVVKNPMLEV